MAGLRIFVSSTCADLDAYRSQIRAFLIRFGYEPVMSDYSEVLYDPSLHTHTSCLRDVQSADLVILLIGSRFGGAAVPQAISTIDFDSAAKSSSNIGILNEKDKISITQAEAIQAVISDRPIFTFVDHKVYSDHHVYQANKSTGNLHLIRFPSITKQETAVSIFEFINFLSHRSFNNSVQTFQSFADIEEHLLKQWSMLFQRLLQEKREKSAEVKKSVDIVDRIDQLQSAVLQALPRGKERDIARAVVRYRRLTDFLVRTMKVTKKIDLSAVDVSYPELLKMMGVVDIVWDANLYSPYMAILILEDGGFVGCFSYTDDALRELEEVWDRFVLQEKATREAVLEVAEEVASEAREFQRHPESLEEYHKGIDERRESESGGSPLVRRRRRPPSN